MSHEMKKLMEAMSGKNPLGEPINESVDYDILEELEEAYEELVEIIGRLDYLVRRLPADERARANSYWYAHLKSCVNAEEYGYSSMADMASTINTLQGQQRDGDQLEESADLSYTQLAAEALGVRLRPAGPTPGTGFTYDGPQLDAAALVNGGDHHLEWQCDTPTCGLEEEDADEPLHYIQIMDEEGGLLYIALGVNKKVVYITTG